MPRGRPSAPAVDGLQPAVALFQFGGARRDLVGKVGAQAFQPVPVALKAGGHAVEHGGEQADVVAGVVLQAIVEPAAADQRGPVHQPAQA